MQKESRRGYNLDVSLFERLVNADDFPKQASRIPTQSLGCYRRQPRALLQPALVILPQLCLTMINTPQKLSRMALIVVCTMVVT